MKNVIINESQIKLIAKCINEAAKESFDIKKISSFSSFRKRIEYCIENLGKPIGNGSSRIIFQIDDEKVLKLAKNEKGVAQNKFEGEDDYHKEEMLIFPKIFNRADDFSWIVSEYVLPAKSKDFNHCIGMSFKDYLSVVSAIEKAHKNIKRFFHKPIEKELLWKYCENNKFLNKLNDYIGSYPVECGDLYRLSSYGLAMRNGKPSIVILDSGLSELIFDAYY